MKIEEFAKRLDDLGRRYPGYAEDALTKGTRKMVRAIKSKTPVGAKNHPKKLKNSWRFKIKGNNFKSLEANIRSTSPHFHLVNRGVKNPRDPYGHPAPRLMGALNRHKGFLKQAVDSAWPEVKETMSRDFLERVRKSLG